MIQTRIPGNAMTQDSEWLFNELPRASHCQHHHASMFLGFMLRCFLARSDGSMPLMKGLCYMMIRCAFLFLLSLTPWIVPMWAYLLVMDAIKHLN